jgi:hypothetical protein
LHAVIEGFLGMLVSMPGCQHAWTPGCEQANLHADRQCPTAGQALL